MGSLGLFIVVILSAVLWPWGRLSLQQKWVPGIFRGGNGGRCIGLTTLRPSCGVCLEIWEPGPAGTLRVYPGLYSVCFTVIERNMHMFVYCMRSGSLCNHCVRGLATGLVSFRRFPVFVITVLESSWNVMAHGDGREGKWRGNWRMEWVASTLHATSEDGVSSITTITTADAHTSAASSRLNWRPRRFKWTRPFRRKTKSGFCACAITIQTQSTTVIRRGGCGVRNLEYCNATYPRRLWTSSATKRISESSGEKRKYCYIDFGNSLYFIQLCTYRHLVENVLCFLTILYVCICGCIYIYVYIYIYIYTHTHTHTHA